MEKVCISLVQNGNVVVSKSSGLAQKSITKAYFGGDKLTLRVAIRSPLHGMGTGTKPSRKGGNAHFLSVPYGT